MRLYGLKTCDTCRNALKSFPDAEFFDLRADGIPDRLLVRAVERFGDALINRRSATWRGLDQSERARPPLELLVDHPALMKRPLIEMDGNLYLGWSPETRAALGAG